MVGVSAKSSWNVSGVSTTLGVVLGALSVVKLVQHGLHYGLGPTLQIVVDYYEHFTRVMLGWAEPYIREQLVSLSGLLSWTPHLHPHWKHIFVLMGLYFFRAAGNAFRAGYRGTALFRTLWGLAIAAVASVGAGTVPIAQDDIWANALVAAVPIVGVTVHDIGYAAWSATTYRRKRAGLFSIPIPTWWSYFVTGMLYAMGRGVIGLAVLWIGLQMPTIQRLPSPGLTMLGVLIVGLGGYWLSLAGFQVTKIRREHETLLAALNRLAAWRHGTAILATFLGAGLFFTLNAGLGLVGL
jgi:hypothetical protein